MSNKLLNTIEENLDILQWLSNDLEKCPNCENDVKILNFKICPSCGYDFKTFHRLNNKYNNFPGGHNE